MSEIAIAGAPGKEVVLELPVKDLTFDLATAVCSHGLFMMSPNHWDPSTRTLRRPLRLHNPSSSVTVRISQSHPSPQMPLLITVLGLGTTSLSSEDQQALLAQVRRMLRISEDNDRAIQEFHKLHLDSKERGFGRLFRSPTLFEDMVKCILLCNCQWPRTLSMVKALCELQLELKNCSTAEDFHPKTPQPRERKGNRGKKRKAILRLETKFVENEAETAVDTYSFASTVNVSDPAHQSSGDVSCSSDQIGDFPTPEELATLKADFLAKRCGLGYRAQRILSLAQSIVEGRVLVRKLEEVCDGFTSASYDEMEKLLYGISGFGPFTRANVLMCMGFYHRIPADTETIRHLKQFHARRNCTVRTVQEDLESIYRKYEPFQFLAYWSELWGDYEKRFGKMREMPRSHYKLITANNMRSGISKRSRPKVREDE